MIRGILIILMGIMFSTAAFAQSATEADIEARAKDVGHSLRCVVCQNQSIEESDASLAEDMRRLVRSRMKNGDTDAQVIEFMRERYGDYVLLKPPVQRNTYILWFAPFILALLGGIWFIVTARRRKVIEEVAPLSNKEREILDNILKQSD